MHIVSGIEWWKELGQTDQASRLFLILIRQPLSAPGGVYNAPGYNTLPCNNCRANTWIYLQIQTQAAGLYFPARAFL